MREQDNSPKAWHRRLGPSPRPALRVLFVLGWLCLAISVLADEPKVTKNADGSTTTTENVTVTEMNRQGGLSYKDYQKSTTRDIRGKITKIEWYHLGKKGKRRALGRVLFRSVRSQNSTDRDHDVHISEKWDSRE